jgi:hypothetical protein
MRLTRLVVQNPWKTLFLLFVLTLLFVLQVPRLKIETDIGKALPPDLPVRRLYDEVGEKFPSKDVIFIGLEFDNVFTPNAVKIVLSLSEELIKIPGVYDVISPTNVKVIKGSEEGIEVVPALQGDPEDPRVLKVMETRLLSSDFVGNLVSKDRKAFGILVLLKNTANNREVASQILSITDSLRKNENVKVYATGRPVIEEQLRRGLGRDVRMFFTLVILVVILILFLIFRSFRGVFLPFTVVIVSVIWTFGFMAMVGIPFSHSTEFLPVLLISIGIADGIHILHTYYDLRSKFKERREIVLEAMRLMNLPVVMTSLTTAVAFLSLGTAGFVSLRQLGLTVAFGTLVAMILSLYFIPAVLSLLPVPKKAISQAQLKFLHRFLVSFGLWAVRRRTLSLTIIALLVIGFGIGISRLKVENFTIENFKEGSDAREAYYLIADHLAGPEVITAVVRGKEEGALKDPRLLKEMDEFKKHMMKHPKVGNVTGLQDLIKRLNMVLMGGKEEEYRIPDSIIYRDGKPIPGRNLVAQYVALYSLSTSPGELERLVTPDFRLGRMDIYIKEGRRTTVKELDFYAREFIKRDFKHAEEIDLTGSPEILLTVNDMVVTGQTKSILLSLFLVSLLVVIAFRSVVAGIYGIIPLGFALLVNFGLMGWTGIYASLENMVTSNIAIGVGVDYMIHFIHRYRTFFSKSRDPINSTAKTMETSGVAIFLNALAVALGFSTIIASVFKAVSHMGLLISIAMISTCFAALFILPVLLSQFKPGFLLKWREE